MDDKSQFFAVLEEKGEGAVRALLETNQWGTRRAFVAEWCTLKDLERAAQSENREAAMLEVARISATAATHSATAAQDSKDWSKISAITAIVATVIALAALVVSIVKH